jgi:hypothetical protein
MCRRRSLLSFSTTKVRAVDRLHMVVARGRNLYRNRATVEAYVFAPNDDGMSVVLDHAETIAARLRSFRDDSVSCYSADVIPIGPGSSISVPGRCYHAAND